MTNKSVPKKGSASKSPLRTRNNPSEIAVVKHFQPQAIYKGSCSLKIPEIDSNVDKKVISITHKNVANAQVATNKENRKAMSNVYTNMLKLKKEAYSRNSSSSSAETVLDRQNKYMASVRSKSLSDHRSQKRKSKAINEDKRFHSKTDPVLYLNLKADNLKREIAINRTRQPKHKEIYNILDDNVRKLQEEIKSVKSYSTQNKRTLVTELKTEIAEYKRCDSYQVYNFNKQSVKKVKKPAKKTIVQPPSCASVSTATSDDGLEDEKDYSTTSGSTLPERPVKRRGTKKHHPEYLYSDAESQEENLIKSKIQEANILIDRVKNALDGIKSFTSQASEIPMINGSESAITYGAVQTSVNKIIDEAHEEAYRKSMEIDHVDLKLLYLDRPKTKRNENRDEIDDKFQTEPNDYGTLQEEYSSSLEAVQSKLQAISEVTESDASFNPSVQSDLVEDQVNGDEADTKKSEEEMQEQLQLNPKKPHVQLSFTETQTEIVPQESKEVSAHKEYNLMQQTQILTCICKSKTLKAQNQEVLQIGGNKPTLQLQTIPGISIKQPKFCVQKTAHYCINQEGQCYNLLEETPHNVHIQDVHFTQSMPETKSSELINVSDLSSETCEKQEENTSNTDLNKKKYKLKLMDVKMSSEKQVFSDGEFNNCCTEAKSRQLQKSPSLTSKSAGVFDALTEGPLSDEEREMFYKSYNLRDNPNLHDPDPLGDDSLSRISVMDMNIYQTYINPLGMGRKSCKTKNRQPKRSCSDTFKGFVSEKELAVMAKKSASTYKGQSVHGLLSSKSVQCDFEEKPLLKPIESKTYDKKERVMSVVERNSEISNELLKEISSIGTLPSLLIRDKSLEQSFEEISLTISYSTEEALSQSTSDMNMNQPSFREIQPVISQTPHTSETNIQAFSEEEKSNLGKSVPGASIYEKDLDKLKEIKSKLKTIDTQASMPILTLTCKTDADAKTTIPMFIKGLVPTLMTEKSGGHSKIYVQSTDLASRRVSVAQRHSIRPDSSIETDIVHIKDPEKEVEISKHIFKFAQKRMESLDRSQKPAKLPETTSSSDNTPPPNKKHNDKVVMLSTIEANSLYNIDKYSKHLEKASNGRYKDEENLFCEQIYPDNFKKPTATFAKFPQSHGKKYLLSSSNSDTMTISESMSEGEVKFKCKHSVSQGEVHQCKKRLQEVSKKRLPINKRFPKEPFIKVEQRRNYFNNWVTYYVRCSAERINDSTTSTNSFR